MKEAMTPERATTEGFSTSIIAQRTRLLEALRMAEIGGITTIHARECLDVMSPAPRIFELRHIHDDNIQTIWVWDENAQGNRHRTARYILFPGSYKEAKKNGKF